MHAGPELYKEVKRATDGYLGIVSQCFVATKAGIGAPVKRLEQYAANVRVLRAAACALPLHRGAAPLVQRREYRGNNSVLSSS